MKTVTCFVDLNKKNNIDFIMLLYSYEKGINKLFMIHSKAILLR